MAFLRELQAMPSGVARRAELLAFEGRAAAAEEALLSGRLLWGAVELNLRLFNWERALALAEQDSTDRMVAAVLWHRCVALAFASCALCSGTDQGGLVTRLRF